VSVNVSARQLADGALRDQVRVAIDESGLAPERLEIELTESMLIDASIETLLTLSSIRDLGVGVALDDFGTGYAGLATIKRLPLTALKLDRMFVRGVLRRDEDTAIARAIISFGLALGLSTVAEGIEWEAQCRFLHSLGCHQGQSFLLGRPMPAEQFRQLIREGAGDERGPE
jgi:EAL domain-containing protein (putative c-di-GMP-specific phosphodiesterase class I)